MWDAEERQAWTVPEKLTASQWAEKYRVLSRRQTNKPGLWSDLNQPTLRGFMDLCCRPGIREIWVKKYNQGGWSEACRNVIGERAHLRPCPVQLILASKEKGREIVRKRILPLFRDTPVLAELATGRRADEKQTAITLLNSFELALAYASVPGSIASDPQALVILDEVDRYDYRGMQADPIAEARFRTRTWGDRGLLIAISTPSVPEGPIAVGYEKCPVKLFYYAPCPHCGTFQRLVRDNLRWEIRTPAEIAAGADPPRDLTAVEKSQRVSVHGSAWMLCADHDRCAARHPAGGGRILHQHKRQILPRGYWGTEDGSWKIWFDRSRGEEGGPLDANRVGIQVSAFYDVNTPFADVAAELIAADNQPHALKDVFNLTLGEEFHLRVSATTIRVMDEKCRPDPPRRVLLPAKVVPRWASRLLLSIDTQKDHFYYVVRAWGFNYRSARVDHGRVSTFEELDALQFDARWPYEDQVFPPLSVFLAGIDTGAGAAGLEDASRTDQVYQWCNRRPTFRVPLKGANKPFEQHIAWRDVTYQDPHRRREPYRVRLHFVDPLYWADLLDDYMAGTISIVDPATGEAAEAERWMLNEYLDPDYNRQMTNVHKTQVKRGSGYVMLWRPKHVGDRHDYWDCERYNLALAHGPGRCGTLPTPEQLAAEQGQVGTVPTIVGGTRMPDGRPFYSHRR